MTAPGLEDLVRVHMVGAGGAGMSGLAKLLTRRGHTVTGSDLKPGRMLDALAEVGIETWIGHRPDRADSWDLVVASSAVPPGDPELVAAREAQVPVWERPRLLGALTAAMPAVGIAGTHGKTTSTALMVSALRTMGLDPSFLVGGTLVDQNTGAHLGADDRFVLEADEAFGTFLELNLEALLVTNIEADHLDYYGDIESLHRAFRRVAGQVEGPVVVCADDAGSAALADLPGVITFGRSPEATWQISRVTHEGWSTHFTIDEPGGRSHDVTVPKPGTHIALDAAGVLVLCAELGLDPGSVARAMSAFRGVRRRFEIRAQASGVLVVEDYAHHPTEIAATIEAARLGAPGRVWVVFQPHRYTRTADLAAEFGPALSGADRVIVTDIYPAGETPIPGVTAQLVVDSVRRAGGDAVEIGGFSELARRLVPELMEGDLVLLLGAGDVNQAAEPIATGLGART
ncbi:MAG: UDP-N-acetylmuramate--L-alanine ligase [Acidimicrobiia bacterium]|nr:UDP-N-acetylmuramate--L-alanine ligase [Acidimicrobiia bacterium]MBT8215183.1 UDP-N-acetylmuramate--L-alanine ligase [Acidimicrobiia bacterium]NNF69495.1 UDP-N-acetylmuramate--L-alanine ligase [Acidimicrobiia bacterium]NNK91411.1 UDP-N-acetylmuramate--L-alanine ligase [Acidimicrobiia bacterium]